MSVSVCESVDPSPVLWTVVSNRRKRAKAPLEFACGVIKELGKKARVVVNAGASGSVNREKKTQKKKLM